MARLESLGRLLGLLIHHRQGGPFRLEDSFNLNSPLGKGGHLGLELGRQAADLHKRKQLVNEQIKRKQVTKIGRAHV